MRINLSGELIPDEWAEVYRFWGYESGYFNPAVIRNAVANLPAGEELVLEINSVGGSVDAAAEIYSVIQTSSAHIRAEIQSLAASAASYMALACERIDIALPAQMMIHCASWCVGGNKAEHTWAAKQLAVTDDAILDCYVRKSGGKASRDQLREMMEAETYLSARQCLELGLVDGILGEDAQPEGEPLALVASVTGNVMRAMRTLPDIRDLMARRDRSDRQAQEEIDLALAKYKF